MKFMGGLRSRGNRRRRRDRRASGGASAPKRGKYFPTWVIARGRTTCGRATSFLAAPTLGDVCGHGLGRAGRQAGAKRAAGRAPPLGGVCARVPRDADRATGGTEACQAHPQGRGGCAGAPDLVRVEVRNGRAADRPDRPLAVRQSLRPTRGCLPAAASGGADGVGSEPKDEGAPDRGVAPAAGCIAGGSYPTARNHVGAHCERSPAVSVRGAAFRFGSR